MPMSACFFDTPRIGRGCLLHFMSPLCEPNKALETRELLGIAGGSKFPKFYILDRIVSDLNQNTGKEARARSLPYSAASAASLPSRCNAV